MRLIHTADLHLDSKMESNLDKDKADLRRKELLDTFDRLVEYAVSNEVEAILIAGDLFDKPHIRKNARNRVIDAIRLHPEVDFLYLKGNHDKDDFLAEVDEIPSNLRTFQQDEWTSYEYGNVVITGREITKENNKTLSTNLILDQSKINIVMLHGQESNYEGNDHTEVVNLTEFKNKNIDYLALGHIHEYRVDRLDERGSYCYSGCLEGRGFDECREKGFVLLNIEDGEIQTEFVPFAKRCLFEVPVEVKPGMEMAEIIQATEDALSLIREDDLVKIVLHGKTDMDFDMDLPRLLRSFDTRFFFVKVADQTVPEIDYDAFSNDPTLKGEFVRLMQGQDLDEDERLEIIELGLKAILGEEVDL